MVDEAPTRWEEEIGIAWRVGDTLHRLDGPALETVAGGTYWVVEGRPHRDDGPATIRPDGTRMWYRHGVQHRTDGPAVEWADGTAQWMVHARCVRGTDLDLFQAVPLPMREMVADLFDAGIDMNAATTAATRLA